VIFRELEGSRRGLDVVNPVLLTWKPAADAFVARWGFDPIGGAPPTRAEDVKWIGLAIQASASGRVPVVDFPELIDWVRSRER